MLVYPQFVFEPKKQQQQQQNYHNFHVNIVFFTVVKIQD